jgi:hypothetical protein
MDSVAQDGEGDRRFAFKQRAAHLCSSRIMALVSEGWEMRHCLAARVKLRSSQSARKYRIWCISMPSPSACSRRRLAIE